VTTPSLATAFLETVEASLRLADSDEVRDAWGRESSCPGMTVGGLTHHLLKQAGNTVRLLQAPPTGDEPIALQDHYARAAWVEAAPDDQVNVDIRDSDNAGAEVGPDVVLDLGREWLGQLPALLAAPRDPDTVTIPWQGWALATDDFITTRLMELVVHGDDLASSVGLATPTYPEAALTPVFGLLTGVSARRHGATALIRALSRPQRAPRSISAF
jgi:hypothetical protein